MRQRARGVPFTVLDVDSDVCSHKLVLSRPDQHVAWRGNEVPESHWRW